MLEDAKIKLAPVVTDGGDLSAREILQWLPEGETDARALAELARGKLRAKRDALAQAVVGRLEAHHVFLLREQLAHLDDLDAAIARLDAELEARQPRRSLGDAGPSAGDLRLRRWASEHDNSGNRLPAGGRRGVDPPSGP